MSAIRRSVRPKERVTEAELEQARAHEAAVLSDCLDRTGVCQGVHAVLGSLAASGGRISGRALTVRTRPGDNLAVHVALEVALPGDVLVVDGGGALNNALLGELLARWALRRGVVAAVVDGAVRDSQWLASGGLPVFSRGITPAGPYKDGPGAVHEPVAIGGVPVEDGDLIVADHDGVVVVPYARVREVLTAAEVISAQEAGVREGIERGVWTRPWLAP